MNFEVTSTTATVGPESGSSAYKVEYSSSEKEPAEAEPTLNPNPTDPTVELLTAARDGIAMPQKIFTVKMLLASRFIANMPIGVKINELSDPVKMEQVKRSNGSYSVYWQAIETIDESVWTQLLAAEIGTAELATIIVTHILRYVNYPIQYIGGTSSAIVVMADYLVYLAKTLHLG